MTTRDPAAEPFTWDLYARYLDIAIEEGYRFIGFDELADEPEPEGLSIVLRHDIDYAPERIEPIAALESERGIGATYCVLTDSPLYSLDDPAVAAAIRSTLDRGHWLGLHLDGSLIETDEEVVARALADAELLRERFEAPVRAVSFHMPTRREVGHVELPEPLLNTYTPRFFEQIDYASDSNQGWRGKDLAEVLRAKRRPCLQLLIHPFWWRERYAPMLELLEQLAADRGVDPATIITPEQRELAAARQPAERAR